MWSAKKAIILLYREKKNSLRENFKKLRCKIKNFQWFIKRGFGTGCSDGAPRNYPFKKWSEEF